MTITMLWILITASTGSYNQGTANNLGYFVKEEECQKVLLVTKKLNRAVEGQCVQAEVVVVSP